MSLAKIGLTFGGVDVQDPDSIFLEIIRGLSEPPAVRGVDVIVPGRAGRIARNRVADRITIELAGFVRGVGTPSTAPETAGGANTALAADTLAGVTEITVAAADNITAADLLRVGDTGETEIREVFAVDGTTVTLTAPLGRRHDSGDKVREVDSLGSAGDEATFRINAKVARALFDPTANPATLVASLEDGTTATITARALPGMLWVESYRSFAQVSIELESTDADWTVA